MTQPHNSQVGACVCVVLHLCSEYGKQICSAPGSALVDLMGLNTSASTAPSNSESSSLQPLTQNTGISLLDDELASLGKNKEKRKSSWLVNINVDEQALYKQKKKKKSAVPAQLGVTSGHSTKKNAPFMTMVHTIPDVMKHKMVQKHKAINYNKMFGFSLFLGLNVTENCVSQDTFQVRVLRNCSGRT